MGLFAAYFADLFLFSFEELWLGFGTDVHPSAVVEHEKYGSCTPYTKTENPKSLLYPFFLLEGDSNHFMGGFDTRSY